MPTIHELYQRRMKRAKAAKAKKVRKTAAKKKRPCKYGDRLKGKCPRKCAYGKRVHNGTERYGKCTLIKRAKWRAGTKLFCSYGKTKSGRTYRWCSLKRRPVAAKKRPMSNNTFGSLSTITQLRSSDLPLKTLMRRKKPVSPPKTPKTPRMKTPPRPVRTRAAAKKMTPRAMRAEVRSSGTPVMFKRRTLPRTVREAMLRPRKMRKVMLSNSSS